MKPKLLLRIASIVMFAHDIGHTFGHLSWKETPDPAKREVVRQMTQNRFPFMGAVKSLGDYYDGYGFAASLALLLIAAILWIVSGSATQSPALARKLCLAISIILLAWGIDELVFFFPFAAAFSLLAMVLTVVALVQLKPHAE
jgi:hypothetical protein